MYSLLCSDTVKPLVQVDCLCMPHDGQFPHGHFQVRTVNKDNNANVAIITLRSFFAVEDNLLKITLTPTQSQPSVPPPFACCCTTTVCSLLARASPSGADQRMDYTTCQHGRYLAPCHTAAQHRSECSVTPLVRCDAISAV